MTLLRCFLLRIGYVQGCLWLAMFFALTPCSLRAQTTDVCVPSPAVRAALEALPTQTPAETGWEYRQRYQEAIQSLVRQFPDDFFVLRRYGSSGRDEAERTKIIEEYKAKLAQDPDNPRLLYLYAIRLLGRQSPEAIKLFQRALEKDPKFPWPHLPLVNVYSAPAFQDKAKSVAHLRAFLDACPDSLEGYSWLRSVDNAELNRESAPKLRKLLAARNDADAIGAYPTLWSLEFKLRPTAEYDALRKQIAQDVERIRALNLEDKRAWYTTLEEGYKLANDPKQSAWAKEQRQARLPYYYELPAMSKWYEEHKFPGADAEPEKKRAYYTEQLKQFPAWLKERPNYTSIWWSQVRAMVELDDVPSAQIGAAIDQAFKVAQKNAGPLGPYSGEYFNAAEYLSRKHLQPARVVEMTQKGLAKLDEEEMELEYDLYATKENQEEGRFYRVYQRLNALGFLADGYLQLKQANKAQLVLVQIDQRLEDMKALAGDKKNRRKSYLVRLAAYWGRMGRLAEIQGHKQDAMTFYAHALLTRLDAEQKPVPGVKDELAEDAQRLWKDLGGTSEGWKTWYGRRADALANVSTLTWEDSSEALPAFGYADLSGKTWNLESLKGKITFVNFWAVW